MALHLLSQRLFIKKMHPLHVLPNRLFNNFHKANNYRKQYHVLQYTILLQLWDISLENSNQS